jgi:hypothetical protein
MWLLITLIVIAVAVGLFWAYYNFAQIKLIPLGSNFSVDD